METYGSFKFGWNRMKEMGEFIAALIKEGIVYKTNEVHDGYVIELTGGY